MFDTLITFGIWFAFGYGLMSLFTDIIKAIKYFRHRNDPVQDVPFPSFWLVQTQLERMEGKFDRLTASIDKNTKADLDTLEFLTELNKEEK